LTHPTRIAIINPGRARMAEKAARGLVIALLVAGLLAGCGQEGEGPGPAARPALGRVIVIGFDGLDPGLVRQWVASGKLPTFQHLLTNGCFGDLISVLPPTSAPAWVSAVTGVNPGKHGVYGFLTEGIPGFVSDAPSAGGDSPAFTTSSQRGYAAVWEVVGRYGRRSTIINVPLTSPADSLNGLMVAGFPYASADTASYFWPASLRDRLGDYTFDAFAATCAKGEERRFLDDVDQSAARRLRLGLSLFEDADWDLFWLVFTFTDRIQHHMWKYMDRQHPMYEPGPGAEFGGEIEAAYRKADQYLAEFIARMKEGDLLMVMSDHGFGPAYYTINSYNFLLKTLGPVPEVMCADFYGAKFKIAASGPGAEEKYASLRNRLTAGLKALKDPILGAAIIDSVYSKEDIYKGVYLGLAPDVVAEEKDGYLFFTLPRTSDLRLFDAGPSPDRMFSGFHRRRGVIGLYGKNVRPGAAVEARIMDVAATIMGYLGAPAPAELDGRVPTGAFIAEAAQRIVPEPSGRSGYRKPRGLTSQDSKRIEKELRAVGYIQ
jgi:predicted AlkP superfamily phosphohydrolase/phosphomutase